MKKFSVTIIFPNHKAGILLIYFNIRFSKIKEISTENATSRKQKNFWNQATNNVYWSSVSFL